MAVGWIKIHRKLQDCFIWTDSEPFDRRSAWLDLLLQSEHKDKTLLIKGKAVTITRGQRFTSTLKLAERWHWSVNRVRRFLTILEEQQMITTERNKDGIILTIVNYGVYQNEAITDGITNEIADGITDGTPDETADGIQIKNIKNIRSKEVKNIKEKNIKKEKPVRHQYGLYKNVLLSDEDMEKLKREFPKDYQDRIERVSEYCKSKGKSYSDYLATIRSWARKENNGRGITEGVSRSEAESERSIEEHVSRLLSGEPDPDDDGLWD